jgi:ubiquitin-conjugating enzyme E2 O
MKQWSILKKGLPDGIWVKAYEDRIDLMRVIIVGSPGTPYHYGIFCFDIFIPATFPSVPPEVFYRSGGYRLNPNLYENGRICLSLLNTWSGKESEKWDPAYSSILQVLVSIQGLVLVPKPYFNEAGYEKQVGTVSGEKNAILYNESAHLLCLKLVINTLKLPPKSCEDLVLEHFLLFSPLIKKSMEDYSNNTPIGFGGGYSRACEHGLRNKLQFDLTPSAGYKIMLAQIKPRILDALDRLEKSKTKQN